MDFLQFLKELQLKLAQAEELLAKEKQASYDAGFAAGVASVTGGDKIYSQAEFDSKLAEALLPIQNELVVVKAEVEDLKLRLDKSKDLLVKYEAAVAAEIEDAKVDSTRLEAFKASLGE